MEPILHVLIPFIILYVLGVDPRKALIFGVIGVLPDLDFFFGSHRSLTHSIIVLGAAGVIAMLYVKNFKPDATKDVSYILFSLGSHLVFDVFTGASILFWPISAIPVNLSFALIVQMSNFSINPVFGAMMPCEHQYDETTATLFTSRGVILALALILPIMYNLYQRQRLRNI